MGKTVWSRQMGDGLPPRKWYSSRPQEMFTWKFRWLPLLLTAALSLAAMPVSSEELFVSSIFVPSGKFTKGIEGPACDRTGNLYAVSYLNAGNIGMVTPEGVSSLFVTLPQGSAGNGIRFDSRDRMLIADYTGHNILAVDMRTRAVSVYAHESGMSQPNDIAIDSHDVLYASDPDWSSSSGRVWRITPDGAVSLIVSGIGVANGIEVSPDNRTLYVGQSRQNTVQAFDLSPTGELSNQRLLISLPANSLDGMRCDVSGNLYVTRKRSTGGTIAIVSPSGELLREVKLAGNSPSNIAFGGPDGRTCYVMMADNGSIETFRTDTPGLSWKRFQDTPAAVAAAQAPSPKQFTLSGNYPNPFNASTVIEYTLHRSARAELAVYNTLGQQVALLKREMEPAGKHSVVWNAGDLPSGVYVVRLNVDGASETRKMLLMK